MKKEIRQHVGPTLVTAWKALSPQKSLTNPQISPTHPQKSLGYWREELYTFSHWHRALGRLWSSAEWPLTSRVWREMKYPQKSYTYLQKSPSHAQKSLGCWHEEPYIFSHWHRALGRLCQGAECQWLWMCEERWYIHKRALHICKTALHIRRRALDIEVKILYILYIFSHWILTWRYLFPHICKRALDIRKRTLDIDCDLFYFVVLLVTVCCYTRWLRLVGCLKI